MKRYDPYSQQFIDDEKIVKIYLGGETLDEITLKEKPIGYEVPPVVNINIDILGVK